MAHLKIALGAVLLVAAFALGVLAQPLRSQAAAAAAAASRTANPVSSRAPSAVGATVSRNPLTLDIGQQALTERANALLNGRSLANTPLGTTTLHDISVQVREDQIIVSALADSGPTRLPARLAVVPQTQNGRILVHVVAAQLADVSAPEPVRYQVEQYVQNLVEQALGNTHYEVQSIELGSGKLNIVIGDR